MSRSTRSSIASETFIDTCGFHPFLVGNPMHARACRLLETAARARSRFVTTDYVLDETLKLEQALTTDGHFRQAGFEPPLA